jgi:hypothetical protein
MGVHFLKSNPPGRSNGMSSAGPGNGAEAYLVVGGIDELYAELKARDVRVVRDIESHD